MNTYGFPEDIHEEGIEDGKFYNERQTKLQAEKEKLESQEKPDTIRMKYNLINDQRMESDFMYAFLMTAEMKYRRHYLSTMLDVMMQSYGPSVIKNGLGDYEKNIFDNCIKSDDRVAQDALWFIGLYTIPQVTKWLLGEEKTSPKIFDKEKTRNFISNELPKLAEDFLNGNKMLYRTSNTQKPVDDFVYKARHSYILTCGVPFIRNLPNVGQNN